MSTSNDAQFRTELLSLLPRLRRYALARVATPEHADDLVQAACERGWKARAQWEPGTNLACWMFTIMHNLHIDEIRAKAAQGTDVGAEPLEQLHDHAWTRRLEAKEMLTQVVGVMQQLPQWMREVLMLVPVEGLSYREAAAVLGVPVGTVMSRLARARVELMRRLNVADGEKHWIAA